MAKTAFAAALERNAPLIIDGGLASELEAQGCDISNPLWSASLLLDHPIVIAVGLNCSAPQHVVELVGRIRSALPQTAVVAYPNSGEAWDAQRGAWVSTAAPLDFAAAACDWVAAGARIVGGCCRIGPAHIGAMRRALRGDVRQGHRQ